MSRVGPPYCEKVAARTVVGAWTLEFVLRKISDCSAGDCYAKCAGRPRVRSRVALLAALGVTDSAGKEDGHDGRAEAVVERGAASSSAAFEAPVVGGAGLGIGGKAPATELTGAGREADGEVPIAESSDGEDGDSAVVRPEKVRRPPGIPLDLWRLTHGGFPDGDTAMKPPLEAKRARR